MGQRLPKTVPFLFPDTFTTRRWPSLLTFIAFIQTFRRRHHDATDVFFSVLFSPSVSGINTRQQLQPPQARHHIFRPSPLVGLTLCPSGLLLLASPAAVRPAVATASELLLCPSQKKILSR